MIDDLANAFSEPKLSREPSRAKLLPVAISLEHEEFDLLLRDIATDLYNDDELSRMYGIEPQELNAILADPTHAPTLRAYRRAWYAEANREERMKRKLLYLTEAGLDEVGTLLVSDGAATGTKLAAFDSLQKVAGAKKAAEQVGAGAPRFAINILIGEQPVRIDGRVLGEPNEQDDAA
jgi:hypothetical protein